MLSHLSLTAVLSHLLVLAVRALLLPGLFASGTEQGYSQGSVGFSLRWLLLL